MRLNAGGQLLAFLGAFTSVANCARVCGNGTATSGKYQYRIIDLRYDGPDPAKELKVSTIAVALGSSTTPLYECVSQWPEQWAGFYEGKSNIIWTDCIWTGAGFGTDSTVGLAVDWKNKTLYLSHTFDCSDKRGSSALATGLLKVDFSCTTLAGSDFCIPNPTATGARPDLRVDTAIVGAPAAVNATSDSCVDSSSTGHSWKVEKWLRKYELAPGSSSTGSPVPLKSDTGPSFSLRSLANGLVYDCASAGQKEGVFEGLCKPSTASEASASFTFDPRLNILKVSEQWTCSAKSLSAVGIAYIQGSCDRGFNSVQFTCTSEPVWVSAGTG